MFKLVLSCLTLSCDQLIVYFNYIYYKPSNLKDLETSFK